MMSIPLRKNNYAMSLDGKQFHLNSTLSCCEAQTVFSSNYQVECSWRFMRESQRFVLMKIAEIFSVMILFVTGVNSTHSMQATGSKTSTLVVKTAAPPVTRATPRRSEQVCECLMITYSLGAKCHFFP